jgi:hypothetical protein
MYKQEIAARLRNRKVLTPQEITKETFSKLQINLHITAKEFMVFRHTALILQREILWTCQRVS